MAQFVGITTTNRAVHVRVPAVVDLPAPTGVTATGSGTGGVLAAATYYYVVTAVNAQGESIASEEASVTTTGATSSVTVAWDEVDQATGYRVYRGTTSGGQDTYYTDDASPFTDTGAAGTAASPPTDASGYYGGRLTRLEPGVVTVVDVDDAMTRKALNDHRAIGTYTVAALNNNAHVDGVLTDLPANS